MTSNALDIVLSSRIRLARNIDGLPYPAKLRDERASQISRKVYEAINDMDTFDIYKMSSSNPIDVNVLKEKHLISPDLITNNQFGSAIINESQTISIMINEEDHIREQCILKGLNLYEAYKIINAVDDSIGAKVKFSYDEKLGFLTSCPTNLGTGMRASAMMFLPGLTISKSLEQCVSAVARLNMTIRGVYGEGSGASGYIYQISNQKTLGLSETEIIESVKSSVDHIMEAETRARDALMRNVGDKLKDQILRAYGIITNAYMLESEEFMQLIALVKLGEYYKLIKVTDRDRLEQLFTDAQPANILNVCGKKLNNEERDLFRANYVSKVLKSITKREA